MRGVTDTHPLGKRNRYGYVTNTQVKFMIATADIMVQDSALSAVRAVRLVTWCLGVRV